MKLNLPKMKKTITKSLLTLFMVLGLAIASFAQSTLTESFDAALFPPAGWANVQQAGTGLWNQTATGTSPACTPHSGAGMARFNSFSFANGTQANLISPVQDYSLRGANTPTVSFWMYRDNGYSGYLDRVLVYVNTTNSITGATLLGTIYSQIAQPPVVATAGWYQYSFNVPAGFAGTSNYVIFSAISNYGNNMFIDDASLVSYPSVPGTITGWVRNSALNGIIGATVSVGAAYTTTGPSGTYSLSVAPGTATVVVTANGYNGVTETGVVVPSGGTVTRNYTLTSPTMSITPNPFTRTVNPNEFYTENMYILNEGTGNLGWTASLAFPPGGDAPAQQALPFQEVKPTFDDATSRIAFAGQEEEVQTDAPGDILGSIVLPSPITLGWGVGVEGNNVWVSDYNTKSLYRLTPSGTVSASFSYTGWAGSNWVGDLAPAAGPGYIYAVRVGGDNGIHKINTSTGADEATITGGWASVSSARGLAYDATHNEFWIGGWNYTQIYHVTGTGAAIGTIPFSGVAGLGWHKSGNGGTGSLWVSTNAATSMIYEVNPTTGATIRSFAVPGVAGYTGAGLEIDGLGNVWAINQTNQTLYKIDSGTPISSWFTLDSYSGTVTPFTNYALPAHFNAFGLTSGTVKTCTATFASTPDVGVWSIPVTMIVDGPALVSPADLTATIVNDIDGLVNVAWTAAAGATSYVVFRDGAIVGTPTGTTFQDDLPTYGTYAYEVSAVFPDGYSNPAGPVEVEWANPTMTWTPSSLSATLFTNTSTAPLLDLTIGNTGEGTLAFEFPDYTVGGDAPAAYCASTSTSTSFEYISNVTFGTINNSTGRNNYADYTSISTDVIKEVVTPFSATLSGPYSSDITRVWIDFNHNETFDGAELLFQYTGLTPAGNITVPAAALTGPTRMRVQMCDGCAVNPCATFTWGEVEDYTVNVMNATFISDVLPPLGVVDAGADKTVKVEFSATGMFAAPGTYYRDLTLASNDPAHASVAIPCTLNVIIPATLTGTVTDCVTDAPIAGVLVSNGAYFGMTDDNGHYSFPAIAGTYTVTFTKVGYATVTTSGVILTAGAVTTLNAEMCEAPYAPACATATVNAEDTECVVTWCPPAGPHELMYDDGGAENMYAWNAKNNISAVKFTPAGYPATVVGGNFFVGDGSFPDGGNIVGATFTVKVFDDNGAAGLPGTQIGDSVVGTITAPGWLTVTGLSSVVESGSFYLAMIQNQDGPNCAPIGVDETNPKAYKSYTKFVTNGGDWVLSAFQDFMMRAIVASPISGDDKAVAGNVKLVPGKSAGYISAHAPYTVPGVEGVATIGPAPADFATDAVHHYKLWRLSGFDPDAALPGAGTLILLNSNLTGTTYTDGGSTWAGLAQGWYAYAIKSVYPNGDESDYIYTNIVGHKMQADVTINVLQTCGFVPAEGAEVSFVGNDYPYEVYTATVPASGIVTFKVWKGDYTLTVTKGGYDVWTADFTITANRTIDVMLEDTKFVPRNLFVDALTLHATWDAPLLVVVDQNFEGAGFPAGWQNISEDIGWFTTTNGGSSFFPIPAHTKYAVANDDAYDGNECCSYLVTPELDLTQAEGFELVYDGYFTGAWGGSASIEYSTDGGASWNVLESVDAGSAWTTYTVDLSAISGAGGESAVMLAFHYNDNGTWADGWAVDNVKVQVGVTPPYGYGVFLDGAFVADTEELEWDYNPVGMEFCREYVAGVAGKYCSGYSALDTYRFNSLFLFPPRNLTAEHMENEPVAILNWEAPQSGDAPAGNHAIISSDYTWMRSTGTLSATGNVHHAGISNGFTANVDRADVEIKYCGDVNDAIGTGGAADFMVAARFTPTELNDYYGLYTINKMNILLASSGAWSNVTAKIWEGGSLGDAGTEVFSKDVTADVLSDAYTEVIVDAPVALVAGTEYWIGYAVSATGGWPAGCDAGPAVTDKGDLIYFDGAWVAMSSAYGLDYNWNITGILSEGTIPPSGNLVSYIIYRNDVAVAEVPKTELTYWDMGLLPDEYCYDITAKYDVAGTLCADADGFAESMKEGTACVDVYYGYPLPFVEDWTTGQFDVNQWTVGANWIIDGQVGDPYPSAKFKWDPILNDYASALESFYINGKSVQTTTPYKIYFDYSVKLDDRTASTAELLNVDVWNGTAWTTVKSYANNGDFDWTAEHIDISSKAKNKVFKVRFNANGVMSGDIFGWWVDNIHIYAEYTFSPAFDLVAQREGAPLQNDIKLTWSAPEGEEIEPGVWIHYDDGVNSDAIGTGGAFDFSVSALFESADLVDYDGLAVKKIKFFPNESACSYAIRVWAGTDLVVDQAVSSPTIGDWNEITLNTPYVIDASNDLYIGYRCNASTGYPAGCDAGPANAGFGDLLSEDQGATWVSISNEYGLDYNWNLWAFVEGLGDAPAGSFQPIVKTQSATPVHGTIAVDPNNVNTDANLARRTTVATTTQTDAAAFDLTGFNVYRRGYEAHPGGPDPNAADTTGFTYIGSTAADVTTYTDMNLTNNGINCYIYYVKAIYSEGQAVPSNTDWDCIFVANKPIDKNEVAMYPNPAISYLTIELSKDVRNITVYNALGSVVTEQSVTGETKVTLNTSNLAAGAYNVRFTNNDGTSFSRKFVVTK